jgi:hypothetical protein
VSVDNTVGSDGTQTAQLPRAAEHTPPALPNAVDEDLGSVALTPVLALVYGPNRTGVEYVVGGQHLEGACRELAAQGLADDAMEIRCPAPILERWRRRRDGGPQDRSSRGQAVAIYAAIGFGTKEKPANCDHLQGLVAELFWNRLVRERSTSRDGRRLVHAHSVKPDPLEPGGDGLVLYENRDGVLVFRLWEIKKHETSSRVSATINRASKQLSSRGHEYLAKLAAPETVAQGGKIGDLYADMIELWLDRSRRAGVGISVGTSKEHGNVQPRSFGSLKAAFPDFDQVGQTEAIVVAIPEFGSFAKRVREIVWSGL